MPEIQKTAVDRYGLAKESAEPKARREERIEHTAAPGGQRPIRWCPGLEAGPQRSTLLLKNTIINLEIQNNNNAAITIKVTIKVQTRMDNRVRLSVDHRMK